MRVSVPFGVFAFLVLGVIGIRWMWRREPSARLGVRFLFRLGLAVGTLVVLLLAVATGVYVWALTATDTSQLARAVVWGESDVGDQHRFPFRTIQAGSEALIFSDTPYAPLAEIKIDPGQQPLNEFLENTKTTAFIVLHGNELIYEGYFNGSSREDSQTSFSVAKSFTATLVGIAIEEGHISGLDDPITVYVPELLERDARFAEITLRHLITMSSGIRFAEWASPWDDPTRTYYATDLRSATLAHTEIERPPGTEFHYNDYNPALLGMALERATGMSVSEYMETRLWQPMGAEADGSWSLDGTQSGFERMFVGVNGRAIDFAKLGWLYLNEGRNGDHQVVPRAWVEEATRVDVATDPASHYQYYWWVDEDHNAYYAQGDKCQYIYVHPDADLVLVRHGRECSEVYWAGFLGDIAEELERMLRTE